MLRASRALQARPHLKPGRKVQLEGHGGHAAASRQKAQEAAAGSRSQPGLPRAPAAQAPSADGWAFCGPAPPAPSGRPFPRPSREHASVRGWRSAGPHCCLSGPRGRTRRRERPASQQRRAPRAALLSRAALPAGLRDWSPGLEGPRFGEGSTPSGPPHPRPVSLEVSLSLRGWRRSDDLEGGAGSAHPPPALPTSSPRAPKRVRSGRPTHSTAELRACAVGTRPAPSREAPIGSGGLRGGTSPFPRISLDTV